MEIRIKDKLLTIEHDEDPEDPREHYENTSKLVLTHKNYNFPNDLNINFEVFDSWEEIREHLIKEYKPLAIAPIYLYEHSGLWLKIGDFSGMLSQGHAEFDSGQIGFALITREDMKKIGFKRITKKKAEEILTNDVEIYGKYISGEVFGYRLEKIIKCNIEHEHKEDLASCWGFYSVEDAINHALEDLSKADAKKFKEEFKKGGFK